MQLVTEEVKFSRILMVDFGIVLTVGSFLVGPTRKTPKVKNLFSQNIGESPTNEKKNI